MPTNCPHCNHELTGSEIAALMGSIGGSVRSETKSQAARDNGRLGGRPRKKKKGKNAKPKSKK